MKPDTIPPCVTALETGLAGAVLSEIAELMKALVERGESAGIALKSLPMSAGDLAALEKQLGRGEVFASLDVAGPTEVWETSYAGVWWIRHFGANDLVAAEEISVTQIPEILRTHIEDIRLAEQRIRAEINSSIQKKSEMEALHV